MGSITDPSVRPLPGLGEAMAQLFDRLMAIPAPAHLIELVEALDGWGLVGAFVPPASGQA